MILPQVSELLARVARRPVVEEAFETLRRGGRRSAPGGAYRFREGAARRAGLRGARPAGDLSWWNRTRRAEALVEPMRWFYRAVTGKPGHRVAYLPAHEVLPYENRSPHAEISEARAVALWRFATGEADLLIAPIQAALWRDARAGILPPARAHDRARRNHRARRTHRFSGWRRLRKADNLRDARAVCRPRRHHRRFLARGAAARAHRAAGRYDRIDPRFRSRIRSARPIPSSAPRCCRSPNFLHPREVLERSAARSGSGREEDDDRARLLSRLGVSRNSSRRAQGGAVRSGGRSADCAGRAVRARIGRRKISRAPGGSFRRMRRTRWPSRPSATSTTKKNGALRCSSSRAWRSSIWRSRGEGAAPVRSLQTQPTTRYHGNVPAFMAEVRGRLARAST